MQKVDLLQVSESGAWSGEQKRYMNGWMGGCVNARFYSPFEKGTDTLPQLVGREKYPTLVYLEK